MKKRLCAECGVRPAKHVRRGWSGWRGTKMGKDRDHDLCMQCNDSLFQSQKARIRKERESSVKSIVALLLVGYLLAATIMAAFW